VVATSRSLPSHRFYEGQYCQQTWKRSVLELDRWTLRKTSWLMTHAESNRSHPLHASGNVSCSQCVVVVVVVVGAAADGWMDGSGDRQLE
jgi:hypothetical protein